MPVSDSTPPEPAELTELLVSVDVETGGPVPGLYPLLALGACLVEDTADRFYIELRPGDKLIEPEAVLVSWPDASPLATVARLEREGLSEAEAFARFSSWLEERAAGRRVVYVAFNAAFDWAFTHSAFVRLGLEDPFGHAPLDVKSYWAGRARVSLEETRKSRLPATLSADLGEHSHRADEDAARQAEIFKRMRDWDETAESGG